MMRMLQTSKGTYSAAPLKLQRSRLKFAVFTCFPTMHQVTTTTSTPVHSSHSIALRKKAASPRLASHWHPKRSSVRMTTAAMDGRKAISEAFEGYKRSFPDVEDITPAELNELQYSDVQQTYSGVVLVDVRTTEEQQVSMIQGAVAHENFQPEAHRDRLIVTYCTAGLRSGKYAAQLQQQGFRVKNLHGSIVLWAHEGLPLYQPSDGKEVKRLHAYGKQWADMVEGSGYETVVFERPLLRGAMDMVKGMWPFK